MEEKRFVDLEIKMSHHEQMLEDLSQVIFRQQKQIDALETKFSALNERIKAGKDELEIGPANDKPPHY